MKNLPIKITYDFDENEYIVFVKGIDLEGRGNTEARALLDFFTNYEQLNEKIIDKNYLNSIISNLESF